MLSPKESCYSFLLLMFLRSFMKHLKIGTRQSPLALIQAAQVKAHLEKARGLITDVWPMESQGDLIKGDLKEAGGKALFCSGLNHELLSKHVDLVVHSLKDMEPEQDPQFATFYLLPAADMSDVFIGRDTFANLEEKALRVGTSSPRRAAQINYYMPHASIVPLRGNMLTRLDKLTKGECDAMLMAKAGVDRQNLAHEILSRGFVITKLSTEKFIPAAGQGIIAVQCRSADRELCSALDSLQLDDVYKRATVEKAFLSELSGDCHTAVGVYAHIAGDNVHLNVAYYENSREIRMQESFLFKDYPHIVIEMVKKIESYHGKVAS